MLHAASATLNRQPLLKVSGEEFADILVPYSLDNQLLSIERLPEHNNTEFNELKDPSIVQLTDGSFLMYASVGSSVTQKWIVGRFAAAQSNGHWKELPPVEFKNLSGAELCAPAVSIENINGKDVFTMYIQTTCFSENGIIAFATSEDGHIFRGHDEAIASKDTIIKGKHPIIGVYDAGISEVTIDDTELLCMVFSAYRRVGCGDIYMTTRPKYDQSASWSSPTLILAQEDVPFHNDPSNENFEWGLEGGKIIQIFDGIFLLIGVCFLPKPNALGTRQRVFFAASYELNGKYIPLGTPFHPTQNDYGFGEHGHPDTIVNDKNLEIVYQERFGDGHPWHLRFIRYDLEQLSTMLKERLIVYSIH
ncbi:MAG: hypothetical protein M3Q44_06015 [bacterium]|nr:hypothetical protein [bacterium]